MISEFLTKNDVKIEKKVYAIISFIQAGGFVFYKDKLYAQNIKYEKTIIFGETFILKNGDIDLLSELSIDEILNEKSLDTLLSTIKH